jgi:hypothetical protein
MTSPQAKVVPNLNSLVEEAADPIASAAPSAIADHHSFSIALSRNYPPAAASASRTRPINWSFVNGF